MMKPLLSHSLSLPAAQTSSRIYVAIIVVLFFLVTANIILTIVLFVEIRRPQAYCSNETLHLVRWHQDQDVGNVRTTDTLLDRLSETASNISHCELRHDNLEKQLFKQNIQMHQFSAWFEALNNITFGNIYDEGVQLTASYDSVRNADSLDQPTHSINWDHVEIHGKPQLNHLYHTFRYWNNETNSILHVNAFGELHIDLEGYYFLQLKMTFADPAADVKYIVMLNNTKTLKTCYTERALPEQRISCQTMPFHVNFVAGDRLTVLIESVRTVILPQCEFYIVRLSPRYKMADGRSV